MTLHSKQELKDYLLTLPKFSKIACIGSRKIDAKTEKLMEKIGLFIVDREMYLASGNAQGSDQAYARGANRHNPMLVKLYLPWESYEKQAIVKGNNIICENNKKWEEVAAEHHPCWDDLKDSVKKLMTRNAGIVLDSKCVIAYINPETNGTKHGFSIAETYEIPRIDLGKI